MGLTGRNAGQPFFVGISTSNRLGVVWDIMRNRGIEHLSWNLHSCLVNMGGTLCHLFFQKKHQYNVMYNLFLYLCMSFLELLCRFG